LAERETHDSVTAMAGAYAQRAVEAGHGFSAQLDFSENSLMELETILDQLSRDMAAAQPSSDELNEVCKTWGSYFGEVVRRRYGGDWSIETYPGKQFATLTLSVNGNKIFPSMKVHRRLVQGGNENVWSFYKMVKAKLDAVPGSRIQ
jgi:hypothetical protein